MSSKRREKAGEMFLVESVRRAEAFGVDRE